MKGVTWSSGCFMEGLGELTVSPSSPLGHGSPMPRGWQFSFPSFIFGTVQSAVVPFILSLGSHLSRSMAWLPDKPWPHISVLGSLPYLLRKLPLRYGQNGYSPPHCFVGIWNMVHWTVFHLGAINILPSIEHLCHARCWSWC